jgi:hypothetical protein
MKVAQTIYCLWAEWLEEPVGYYDTLETAKKISLEIYAEHSDNPLVTVDDWMERFMYIEEIEVYSEKDE